MVDAKLGPDHRCPIAFFPYSSVSRPLDLVAAAIDKLSSAAFRPQIMNLEIAILQFLRHYSMLRITCHSHGALLVKRALTALGLKRHTDMRRILIFSFGPAELVPRKTSAYEVRACMNYVNSDDILVETGVLQVPPRLLDTQTLLRERSWRFLWGGDECHLFIKASGKSPGEAHSYYPFTVGVDCRLGETDRLVERSMLCDSLRATNRHNRGIGRAWFDVVPGPAGNDSLFAALGAGHDGVSAAAMRQELVQEVSGSPGYNAGIEQLMRGRGQAPDRDVYLRGLAGSAPGDIVAIAAFENRFNTSVILLRPETHDRYTRDSAPRENTQTDIYVLRDAGHYALLRLK